MDVIYHGGNPLGYHSAPSGFEYVFVPGAAQKVKPADEEFFRDMARSPGSHWEVVGMVMVKPEAEPEAVEELKTLKRGGKR